MFKVKITRRLLSYLHSSHLFKVPGLPAKHAHFFFNPCPFCHPLSELGDPFKEAVSTFKENVFMRILEDDKNTTDLLIIYSQAHGAQTGPMQFSFYSCSLLSSLSPAVTLCAAPCRRSKKCQNNLPSRTQQRLTCEQKHICTRVEHIVLKKQA